ncbi:hypothetical protein Tco_0557453, partial [Tanacetum coccineum]
STSSQPKKKQKSKRKQRKEAETAHAETEEKEHLNTPSNDPVGTQNHFHFIMETRKIR